jgi:hypothetical protein
MIGAVDFPTTLSPPPEIAFDPKYLAGHFFSSYDTFRIPSPHQRIETFLDMPSF